MTEPRESALSATPRCSCELGCNSPCSAPVDCDFHGPTIKAARAYVPPSIRTMLNLNANRRIE